MIVFTLLRHAVRGLIDLVGLTNFLWLRNTIARERGIAAYEAWKPFERIRPADCPQEVWEERFAWPKNEKPPYPPLAARIFYAVIGYVILIVGVVLLLQYFTPLHVLSWLGLPI